MIRKQLAFDIAAGDGLGEDMRSKTLAQRADCTQGTDGETCLVSLGRLYEQSKVLLDIYQQERTKHTFVVKPSACYFLCFWPVKPPTSWAFMHGHGVECVPEHEPATTSASSSLGVRTFSVGSVVASAAVSSISTSWSAGLVFPLESSSWFLFNRVERRGASDIVVCLFCVGVVVVCWSE